MQQLERLRNVCDAALENCTSFTNFVEQLEEHGVTVSVRATKTRAKISSLIYQIDGNSVRSEDLGRQYGIAGLARRGAYYDPVRDRATVERCVATKAEQDSMLGASSPANSQPPMDLPTTVRSQLAAFGTDPFEIGIRSSERSKTTHRTWSLEETVRAVPWLQAMNASGNDIYVRPGDYSKLILLDDLQQESVQSLNEHGFEPAAIVEISPGKYQVWLKLPRDVSVEEIIRATAARYFAHTFGADLKSAGAHHFGFLAGFSNHNPKLMLADRQPPQVMLRGWSGQMMSKGAAVVEQADRLLDYQGALKAQKERVAVIRSWVGTEWADKSGKILLPPLEEYRREAQNLLVAQGAEVDWAKIDRRIVRDMLERGHYTREQVVQALMQGSPNISSLKPVNMERDAQNLIDESLMAKQLNDVPEDNMSEN